MNPKPRRILHSAGFWYRKETMKHTAFAQTPVRS
jgi:hypothetical protein